MTYPDYPAHHPAWEIDRAALSLGKFVHDQPVIVAACSALVAHYRLSRRSRGRCVTLVAAPRIDLEIDWQDPTRC